MTTYLKLTVIADGGEPVRPEMPAYVNFRLVDRFQPVGGDAAEGPTRLIYDAGGGEIAVAEAADAIAAMLAESRMSEALVPADDEGGEE